MRYAKPNKTQIGGDSAVVLGGAHLRHPADLDHHRHTIGRSPPSTRPLLSFNAANWLTLSFLSSPIDYPSLDLSLPARILLLHPLAAFSWASRPPKSQEGAERTRKRTSALLKVTLSPQVPMNPPPQTCLMPPAMVPPRLSARRPSASPRPKTRRVH